LLPNANSRTRWNTLAVSRSYAVGKSHASYRGPIVASLRN
jgi:hypothetical protein